MAEAGRLTPLACASSAPGLVQGRVAYWPAFRSRSLPRYNPAMRRRFQFSLRTMFWLVVCAACFFAGVRFQDYRRDIAEQEAQAAAKEAELRATMPKLRHFQAALQSFQAQQAAARRQREPVDPGKIPDAIERGEQADLMQRRGRARLKH